MRKAITILLLSIHLFNLGGYHLMFNHFEQKAGRQFVSSIDEKEFDEEELIEIRVPIELPYMQNWDQYERYDGEVFVDGVHYNYVKRKLVNDSMSFLCLPNVEKNRLYNARETFFALVNDIEKEDGKKELPAPPIKFAKSVTFDCTTPELFFELGTFVKLPQIYIQKNTDKILNPLLMGVDRPPADLV